MNQIAIRVGPYVVALLLGGCTRDAAPGVDFDLATDDIRRIGEEDQEMAVAADLAAGDFGVDLAFARDLAQPEDLAQPVDAAQPPNDLAQPAPDLMQLPPDLAGCMPLETACTAAPNEAGGVFSFSGSPNASPYCCSGWCWYIYRFSSFTAECCIPPGGACTTASDCCRDPNSFTRAVSCQAGVCTFQ